MIHTEKYEICLEIEVSHGYYHRLAAPVSLLLDNNTAAFFRQSGWLFRQQGEGRWLVLRKDDAFEGEAHLVFHVKPADQLFYHVTASAEADGARLEIICREGTWGILTVDIKRGEMKHVRLRIHPPVKKLEFVLIPRHTDPSAVIEMREAHNKVRFLPPKKDVFLGNQVLRVVSEEEVALSVDAAYSFQLWEIRGSRERLLAESIPPPRPSESSIADPQGAVTGYFYY